MPGPVGVVDEIATRIGPPIGPFVGGWLRHLWEYANKVYGREGIAIHDLYALAGAAGVLPDRWEWYSMRIGLDDDDRGTIYAELFRRRCRGAEALSQMRS
ncbi:MAG: hypothetical protein R2849_16950 [Thermomicrobiales bacterium]